MKSSPFGEKQKQPSSRKSDWGPGLALLSVGVVLVASTGLGALLGYWLDGEFEKKPWLMVAGILLGTAAGFVQMYRIVTRFLK